VKDISLIYDLNTLFKLDKEKSEIMKNLRLAKIANEKSSNEDHSGTL
jgi:hypothetical protein